MLKEVLYVTGMTCSSCAQGIARHLEKKGVRNVLVDFEHGELEFELDKETLTPDQVIQEVRSLGYHASKKGEMPPEVAWQRRINSLEFRFIFCLILTLPLFSHMFVSWHYLHLPVIQFLLALPVLCIGLLHFGKSALGSIRAMQPNMDVLITIGSTSAFLYSCLGWFRNFNSPNISDYLFFETSATIITLLLLGNIIEKRSLKKTQAAMEELLKIQPQTARKIINALTENEQTLEIPANQIHINDLILINTGEKIPADGVIYSGRASVDQSMMTGESIPVEKGENEEVLSGTIVLNGFIKVLVKQAGTETMLSQMIETVRNSVLRKPSIQRFGDKVSAWFVPLVIVIAFSTFFISNFILHCGASESLLRSIAVLVISCPCAMGLATPTAVAVGIGRSARNGIMVKGGDTLERLHAIDTIVFDKTGTLTEGHISIKQVQYFADEKLVQSILGTLEQYSTHPLATALTAAFMRIPLPSTLSFSEITEVPGAGINARDKDGNFYKVGSGNFTGQTNQSAEFQVYLTKNNELMAAVEVEDALKSEAAELVKYFKQNEIRTVLLSGDRQTVCEQIADALKIDETHSEMLPNDKVNIIRTLQMKGTVAMAGDGINDAPALALATVGIAMNRGTQLTKQTADIVLVNSAELKSLAQLHELSRQTMLTIKQNLIWALLYNLVAIPMAAAGFLSPMLASLSMAFSDVVVIGNSIRLRYKTISELK